MPSFYKEEKLEKFFKQWEIKNGLEEIKMHQALIFRPGDQDQLRQFKEEIEEYLAYADQQMLELNLKDVYVTDHKPTARKVMTLNQEEDKALFKYYQELKKYNEEASSFA